MIIAIVGDPQTGRINMHMEGITAQMTREVLVKMIEQIDQQLGNGQPPARPSGLVIPNMIPPPPMNPPPAPPVPGLGL
jgi:hypothetical protein